MLTVAVSRTYFLVKRSKYVAEFALNYSLNGIASIVLYQLQHNTINLTKTKYVLFSEAELVRHLSATVSIQQRIQDRIDRFVDNRL